MPEPLPPRELDAAAMVATLNRHSVRYVVIGGFGALLHGSPTVTADVDITPDADPSNLIRLSKALAELGAKLRADNVSEPLAVPLDARTLEQFPSSVNLRTRHGDLDVSLHPAAPGGQTFSYEYLARSAVLVRLPEPVPVASLDDNHRLQARRGSPKDLVSLPLLYELRDRLAGGLR